MLVRSLRSVALLFLAACGSSSNAAPADAGVGDAAVLDAGVVGDGAFDGATGDAGPSPTLRGSVSLLSGTTVDDAGSHGSWLAVAYFERITSEDGPTTHRTVGACDVQTIVPPDGGGFTATEVSAGQVQVTGGAVPVTLSYDAGTAPPTMQGASSPDGGALWSGGEALHVSAPAAAEVPAFELSLIAPAEVTLTAPQRTSATLTLPRASDIALTWTGGTMGTDLTISLVPSGQGVIVTCTFDATAGNGTIPATAMSDVRAGDGVVNVYARGAASTSVAGWTFSATASSPAITGAGAVVNGNVTFQ